MTQVSIRWQRQSLVRRLATLSATAILCLAAGCGSGDSGINKGLAGDSKAGNSSGGVRKTKDNHYLYDTGPKAGTGTFPEITGNWAHTQYYNGHGDSCVVYPEGNFQFCPVNPVQDPEGIKFDIGSVKKVPGKPHTYIFVCDLDEADQPPRATITIKNRTMTITKSDGKTTTLVPTKSLHLDSPGDADFSGD